MKVESDNPAEDRAEARHQKRLAPLRHLAADELRVHEIYSSIQGESTYAGLPCVFVRTTACHLRCSYCDTPHAFTQGNSMLLSDVVAQVQQFDIPLVEITGGEPLLQANVLPLMRTLCDLGHTVLLETSGSLPIHEVDPRVIRIVDFKTPSSREAAANRWEIVASLRPTDEVKFVIGSRDDFLWTQKVIAEHRLDMRCKLLVGTVFGSLDPAELVSWVLEARLPVRVQLQLHKYIWDPKRRGV